MGKDLKAVRDSLFRSDGGGGDLVVSDRDRFRNYSGVGLGINESLDVIVLEGYTRYEAFFGTEFLRVAIARFLVDGYRVSKRGNRNGIVFEGGAEVLPIRNLGVDSGLSNKVEC